MNNTLLNKETLDKWIRDKDVKNKYLLYGKFYEVITNEFDEYLKEMKS